VGLGGVGEPLGLQGGGCRSNLKIGVVGMPNVGKSTLFNLMSKMGIPAENVRAACIYAWPGSLVGSAS
jgi:ribosome-interacting GTPase 1